LIIAIVVGVSSDLTGSVNAGAVARNATKVAGGLDRAKIIASLENAALEKVYEPVD